MKSASENPNNEKKIIEISDEKDEDLAKAIALSLQEAEVGNGVSAEDREISRALEASLAENKSGQKRKRGSIWLTFSDPENPHDRERIGTTPVGLKNVGNTCWFSAVIQSLFHLPKFRQLVINHPNEISTINNEGTANSKAEFLSELQRLFALMVKSKRKYVDPSKVIDILQDASRGSNSDSFTDQQDVSEFTHVLLDWLEESFQDPNKHNPSVNPISMLFYGTCRSSGPGFDRKETFSSFPVCVRDSFSLYDSIDFSLTSRATDSQSSVDRWFTRLPSVLTFELSRFHFDKLTSRTEKIHVALQFDELIYLERFMERSKTATKERRHYVNGLKETKLDLNSKLSKYLNFGCTKSSITEAFDSFLKYLNSGDNIAEQDEAMEVSPCYNECAPSTQAASQCTAACPVVDKAKRIHGPAPGSCSEAERTGVKECLSRWRKDAVEEIKALKDGLASIKNSISTAYSDSSFKESPYRLHAILIHEGQANGGHYWAYIYNHLTEVWRKFNDVQVTDVTWDEVLRDSVGGYRNASAYCLMYVNAKETGLFTESNENEVIPEHLDAIVLQDNSAFDTEITTWNSNAESSEGRTAPEGSEDSLKLPATPHAASSETVAEAQIELRDLIERHTDRLLNVANHLPPSADTDYRLLHFVIYLMRSNAAPHVIERGVLEYFICGKDNLAGRGEQFSNVVTMYIQELASKDDHQQQYMNWRRRYEAFIEANVSFVRGIELQMAESYTDALIHLRHADLIANGNRDDFTDAHPLSGFKIKKCKIACSLAVNQEAIDLFGSTLPEANLKAQAIVRDLVIPYCREFSTSFEEADNIATEEIRQKWFALLLSEDMEGTRRFQLEDILTKLVQEEPLLPTDEIKSPKGLPRWTGAQLSTFFSKIIRIVNSNEKP